ncbi:MAG TPA: hypothetical protein DDW52_07235 [Planctomycetaceae bacterium]|nr:hypothetical protein [Planctomycetaceae bacterium]
MHAALWTLIRLDIGASLRGLLNVRKSWRQLGLAIVVVAFIAMIIWARSFSDTQPSGRFGAAAPFWALVYLLMTWLTASADRGLIMRPAEIHFLVGGPFPRRDVITLTLVRLAIRSVVGAVFLSLIARTYATNYLTTLVGIWLLICVSLLVGMVVSLASGGAQSSVVVRLRRATTVAALSVLCLLVWQAMELAGSRGEVRLSTVAASAPETAVGRIVMPPVAWMFAPLSAQAFFPDVVWLLPARLGVLGVLVGLIYVLGGDFAERVTARTDRSLHRKAAARRGGVAGTSWTSGLRVPMMGKGPLAAIAWSQLTHTARVLPRYAPGVAALVGVVLVILFSIANKSTDQQTSAGWLVAASLYADFLIMLQLPLGMLGPVAQREMLKAMPIAAWKVAIGLLAGPLAFMIVVHLLVLGVFVGYFPIRTSEVLCAAVAAVPGAFLIAVTVNVLALWGILKPKALQQRDALAAGRAIVSVWFFMLALLPAVVPAVAVAIVYRSFGGSAEGSWLAVAGVLAFATAVYAAALAWAFSRWQPPPHERGSEDAELKTS